MAASVEGVVSGRAADFAEAVKKLIAGDTVDFGVFARNDGCLRTKRNRWRSGQRLKTNAFVCLSHPPQSLARLGTASASSALRKTSGLSASILIMNQSFGRNVRFA